MTTVVYTMFLGSKVVLDKTLDGRSKYLQIDGGKVHLLLKGYQFDNHLITPDAHLSTVSSESMIYAVIDKNGALEYGSYLDIQPKYDVTLFVKNKKAVIVTAGVKWWGGDALTGTPNTIQAGHGGEKDWVITQFEDNCFAFSPFLGGSENEKDLIEDYHYTIGGFQKDQIFVSLQTRSGASFPIPANGTTLTADNTPVITELSVSKEAVRENGGIGQCFAATY